MHDPKLIHPDELKPHPKNYRHHPPSQIEHIAASIQRNGFYRNVVAAADLTILAGHGQTLAAQHLGMDAVPVVVLDLKPNSPQAIKILAADNTLGQFAVDDTDALAELLTEVDNTDLDGLLGTGYDDEALASLADWGTPHVTQGQGWEDFQEYDEEPEEDDDGAKYTRKITPLVYEPTRLEPPVISEMMDPTRTVELIQQIKAMEDLPDEVAEFLIHAAHRHTRFNFKHIAEYYAHAEPLVQELMEASTLIIIDLDQAIEQGFLTMTERLETLFQESEEIEHGADQDD